MSRRFFPILSVVLLFAAANASARIVHVPLDPATLGGADIFTGAEAKVARAAKTAGLDFVADPRPLPPQVIVPLDTAKAAVQKRKGILFWRGDMLPDQLAPAETGTLIRKHPGPGGIWKTIRTKENYALASRVDLLPVVRTNAHFALPRLLIETPYQLGNLGDAPVLLVLWRTAEEDTAPLGGAIALQNPDPALLAALSASLPPFAAQADWAAEFDALAP
jgi:hypothetical protein